MFINSLPAEKGMVSTVAHQYPRFFLYLFGSFSHGSQVLKNDIYNQLHVHFRPGIWTTGVSVKTDLFCYTTSTGDRYEAPLANRAELPLLEQVNMQKTVGWKEGEGPTRWAE